MNLDARPMTIRKRRWFRFSLATLFVVMTVAAAALWFFGKDWRSVRERQIAIQFLEAHGGRVQRLADPGMKKVGLRRPLPRGLDRFGAEPVAYVWIPKDLIYAKD